VSVFAKAVSTSQLIRRNLATTQLLFAEKHVPAWVDGLTTESANRWDGGYNNARQQHDAYNPARVVAVSADLFARGRNDPNRTPTEARNPEDWPRGNGQMLGSAHPGIVQFLVGDGAVRSIPITTPPRIIWNLTCVDDGTPAALP